jgi:hypothetical protein
MFTWAMQNNDDDDDDDGLSYVCIKAHNHEIEKKKHFSASGCYN